MHLLTIPRTLVTPLALTTALLFTASVQAQDTGLPLWEAGVFGGSLSSPAYPGSAERLTRTLALPYFIYRGDVFRVDRGGIGARMMMGPDVELDVGFAGSLPASSADIAVRDGMPDLGTLLEFGPVLKVTLARPQPGSRLGLEIPVRGVFELNGGLRSQGFAFQPSLVWETRDIGGGWSLSASGGLVWGDAQLNQYFYGVPQAYATAQRPAFDAQAGLIGMRASLSSSKNLGPDLRLFAYARQDQYNLGANLNSPLALQSTGQSLGLGLSWVFGRSDTRVGN
ncbi:MAG: MipA/OmpV family protein [Sulfuritalea sp.]|nr:MipA/OmpV family protein [Sulfuritalea sp.]